MNSNFNQQSNYQFGYQAPNESSFDNQFSPNFEFREPQAPSFLSRNNQTSLPNTVNSPPSMFASPNQQRYNSFSDSYSQTNYNQYDSFGNTMGENMFFQSSNAMTPKSNYDSQFENADQGFGEQSYTEENREQSSYQEDEEEEEEDLVQNYGLRNSEVYREKRQRNNEAVRKARAKFTQKNKAAIARVQDLRKENIRLQHEKQIVQGRYDEVKEIFDSLCG